MSVLNFSLQNAQTIASPGTSIAVTNAESVNIAISGTSTSFTINFEASLDGVVYAPIDGNPMANTTTALSSPTTSTLNQLWEFDVPAISYLRANLAAIANGYVTVNASSYTETNQIILHG